MSFSRRAVPDTTGEDTDTVIQKVIRSISVAAEVSVPNTSTNSKKRTVPWWTPDCQHALRKRNRRYIFLNKEPPDESVIAYKHARTLARRTLRQSKRDPQTWLFFNPQQGHASQSGLLQNEKKNRKSNVLSTYHHSAPMKEQ